MAPKVDQKNGIEGENNNFSGILLFLVLKYDKMEIFLMFLAFNGVSCGNKWIVQSTEL